MALRRGGEDTQLAKAQQRGRFPFQALSVDPCPLRVVPP